MQALAYTRCSTVEQTDSGLGLSAQRAAITTAADGMGLAITSWFTDEGLSGGALEKRLGLLGAIEAIREGDVLIVAKRDRLARDMLLACWIEKEVAKRGGRIISASGEGTNGDDPTAILMRRIVDAFSEYERLVIKSRTKAALAVKRANGKRISRTPFGYNLAADGTTLVVNPAEQAVVAEILAMRNRGLSFEKIAATLTDRRIPTKRGNGRWNQATVRGLCKRNGDTER